MFQLLSLSTEVTFWIFTLIGIALTIVLWKKVSNNRWPHIVARLGIILVIQSLALASVGVTVNRYGEFYESWGDLFGAKQQLAKIAISAQNLSQISFSDIAKAKKTKGGSLIFREVIKGAKSGISDYVYVVASPKIAAQLEQPTRLIGTKYQVIELFPGSPGVPQTWIGTLGGVTTMENLENAGKIGPTIAVIPAINVVAGEDTECMNFVGGAKVETWITDDMHTFMQRFMGIDSRPWSAFGYSTGGWCAAEVAIKHQNQYSAGVSLAGYFQPILARGLSKRERTYLSDRYDLAKLLRTGQRNTKIMIISSVQDKFTHASALNFIAQAASLIPIKYVSIPHGGHNIDVWKPFVANGFLWINAQNVLAGPSTPLTP
jgi:hypothetical protein